MDASSPSSSPRGLLAAALDLILPAQCLACSLPGVDVCADCLALAPVAVHRSGNQVHVAGAYEGALRLSLLRFKEHGQRRLATPLGRALAESVASAMNAEGCTEAVLVAIPSSRRARRVRGIDHMPVLAAIAAEELRARGFEVRGVAFRATRSVSDQVGLDSRQRRLNLQGALTLPAELARSAGLVVVVDDIVTTGATLREGLRAARAQGADRVVLAAIAAA